MAKSFALPMKVHMEEFREGVSQPFRKLFAVRCGVAYPFPWAFELNGTDFTAIFGTVSGDDVSPTVV
jgi:hypothetical protein